jgi:death-on-curing protein
MMTIGIVFLTVEEVLELHREGLDKWGGLDGVRSAQELASAVGMAEQTYEGEYLHEDLFMMAAAYAYHIAQNQPFVDGNKRAGAAAAIVFLAMNGVSFGADANQPLFVALTKLAVRKMNKARLAQLLRDLPRVTAVRRALT